MSRSQTDGVASSRSGRFPDPGISLAIGVMENRRLLRKLRQQDVWLLIVGFGVLFLLLAMPILFEISRNVGERLATGGDASALAPMISVGWVLMVAFGVFSGVTSEGELTDQEAILTIRPPKDVAGGLVAYVLLGYTPFVLLLAGVAGAGIAVGAGAPMAAIGIVFAALAIMVSGVLVGYVPGIYLKGVVRRSPWLTRLKPVLGVGIVFGYFWLSFTGRFWTVLDNMGTMLVDTPLQWFVDVALITMPGTNAGLARASAILTVTVALIPLGALAVGRAGEFTWFVEMTPDERVTSESRSYAPDRIDAALETLAVSPATRGIALTVLVRGYRAPLQLVFVLVPLVVLIPVLDSIVSTGEVPEWFPWMVMAYGGWAAAVSFPLNALGTQGSMLPRLLLSPARGKHIVHGYLLATGIVFVPFTVLIGVLSGRLADWTAIELVILAGGAIGIVLVGTMIAIAIGVTFPRFSTVEITENTQAVLPSKFAVLWVSILAGVLAVAIGVIADEMIRLLLASFLSEHLPLGLTVTIDELARIASGLLGVVVLATPIAYVYATRRLETYHLS